VCVCVFTIVWFCLMIHDSKVENRIAVTWQYHVSENETTSTQPHETLHKHNNTNTNTTNYYTQLFILINSNLFICFRVYLWVNQNNGQNDQDSQNNQAR